MADISLLNCSCFLKQTVISKPVLARLAAWRCSLFIQGLAKKAKFLRELELLAVCMPACFHKCTTGGVLRKGQG